MVAGVLCGVSTNAISQGLSDSETDEIAEAIPGPRPVAPVIAAPAASALNSNRIMGVIPDFQTVRDPNTAFVPLTPKQKWSLALKENVDPFNIFSAALAAGLSQRDNQTPKYGEGMRPYGDRFGAALADFGTQNIFSAGLLATLLHQDPRYYRMGTRGGIVKRVAWAAFQIVAVRKDRTGTFTFNSSGVFGTMMGIAASNLYYPSASRHTTVMLGRLDSSFSGGVIGNLLSEFWPDLQAKFFRHK
jgi:hypothetical protein